jgi:hypothetical protein
MSETKNAVNLGPAGNIATVARGSDEVLKKWVAGRQKLSRNLLAEMVAVAREHGGSVEGASLVADGDDTPRCGNVVLRFPIPHGGPVFEALGQKGLGFHVLTHGIPVPDWYRIEVVNPVINPAQIEGGKGTIGG